MVENLRKLRTNAGLSQQQLADIIGVSQQSINKYENHNVEPDIKTLIDLAKYFNTTVDYLIGYDSEKAFDKNTQKLLVIFNAMNDEQKKIYIEQGKAFFSHH